MSDLSQIVGILKIIDEGAPKAGVGPLKVGANLVYVNLKTFSFPKALVYPRKISTSVPEIL